MRSGVGGARPPRRPLRIPWPPPPAAVGRRAGRGAARAAEARPHGSSASATSATRRNRCARSFCSSWDGDSSVVSAAPRPSRGPGSRRPARRQDLSLDEASAHVVGAGPASCRGDDVLGHAGHAGAARRHRTGISGVAAERPLAGADGPAARTFTIRTSPLELGGGGLSTPRTRTSGTSPRRWTRLTPVSPEGGEHLLDVAQEERVGPDDEDALALEGEPVRVEKVGGPVQRDGGLAGPRSALDDEDPRPSGRADDLVLLALLDGRRRCPACGRCGTWRERGQERPGTTQHHPVGQQPLPFPRRRPPGADTEAPRPPGSTKYSSSKPSDGPADARP